PSFLPRSCQTSVIWPWLSLLTSTLPPQGPSNTRISGGAPTYRRRPLHPVVLRPSLRCHTQGPLRASRWMPSPSTSRCPRTKIFEPPLTRGRVRRRGACGACCAPCRRRAAPRGSALAALQEHIRHARMLNPLIKLILVASVRYVEH